MDEMTIGAPFASQSHRRYVGELEVGTCCTWGNATSGQVYRVQQQTGTATIVSVWQNGHNIDCVWPIGRVVYVLRGW